jgi:hypothetical protein
MTEREAKLERAQRCIERLQDRVNPGSFVLAVVHAACIADSANRLLLLPLLEKLTGQRPSAPPDFELGVNLVGHGLQADYYVNGQHAGTECYDFGDTYKDLKPLRRELLVLAQDIIQIFREKK